jgi:GAF domain-containing protein
MTDLRELDIDGVTELEPDGAGRLPDSAALVTQVDALIEASLALTQTTDSAALFLKILSALRRVVPYDSASVQELRRDRLVIVAGVGFADLDVILGESFDVNTSDTPNGEVVHRRRPIVVADTEQYRAFRRGLHVGSGIRSWLGMPLLFNDRLLGLITLDKAEPAFYTATHERVATAFAAYVALAMANAQR